MDSVRYLSYHQWKDSKGDTSKSPTYHQKLLANVETLDTNVGAIDKLITGYLDATKSFCGAGSQLAESFSTVLKETPLLEISQQLKQVVEEIDHVAHKSSVHITSHILGTLCEFTATLPGLRRAIEAHKRSVQNYESCQENLELLEKDDSLVNNDGKRLKTTRQRFRAATEELTTEEEKLYRSFSEVEENRVKMLGSCFLSLLQVQSQFLMSSADLTASLGGFHEIGDYLRDREVTLALKDATATWLSLAQTNQSLRQGEVLSRQQVQFLTLGGQGELADPERKELILKVNNLLKNYKKVFDRAPTPEADIPAGFHKNPRGIELALKGCCSKLEAMAAGGVTEAVTVQEMEQQILKQIPKLQLKIGYVMTEVCSSPSKANDNYKSKLHCIRDLASSVAKQNDIPLNRETLDMFVLMVLYEACSPVSSSAAKTAVQLLFGRAHLVTAKPSKDKNTRLAQVYVKGTSIHVEVSTTWVITEDASTFACLLKDLDFASPLGTVDAVYTSKFSLMDYLEDKKSVASKTVNNVNTVVDPTNPNAVSGAGTRHESAGNRTSVASSTDTEHDTDIDDPTPLPPPRPRHWARRAKEQSMVPESNSFNSGKIAEEESKADDPSSPSDWSKSVPQFPLLTLKPTCMQNSQSELSLASQEELTEVINFLSGAPIKLRLLSDDDTNPSMAESHMTPVDSGLGSIFSMALSNITQPSSAPTCACEKIDNKESHEVTPFRNQSESKERATTPDVYSIKGAMAMVTMETQTSPSAELCPVLLVKSADSDSEEQCGHQSPAENDEQQNQPSNKEEENDDRIPSPSGTPRPVSPSQTKQDTTDVHAESPDSVPNAETPKLSVENEEQTKSSKAPSPVFVTVSSEECDDDKTLSISESLRSVWEKVSPPSDCSDTVSTNPEGAQLCKKDIHGSQDTLYHSCWSLSDFSGNDKSDESNEDAKSLNESLLPSNSGPGLLDLGLKWSTYGSSIHGNPVWANIPSASGSSWNQSQEVLSTDRSGRGKTVFSLGLGITGPDLLAAARGGSCEVMPSENISFMPNVGKPWSTEDLVQKNPWSTGDSSPPLLWAKTTSLTEDTLRPSHHRPHLPPQHYSDPFLPRENWWPQGRGGAPPGIPTPPMHGTIQIFNVSVLLTTCNTECREAYREAVVQWAHSRHFNRFKPVIESKVNKYSRLVCRYLRTTRQGMGPITTQTPAFSYKNRRDKLCSFK
ncbi:hypothetical protein OS493_030307 [Desmophyllum pertusum]|uniref:DUF4745 domain-containing protein n=1 Tax=Desmophyllum pertusum TaxID=174260 RepID=A0A9W9ZKT6_9CNID|nr:hypothetical protein OS493_030307 [Desmophyllum pertusum]